MVPSWISKKCCRSLKNPVTIFVDDGSSWRVNWIKVGENIWFNNGWEEVALHCRLKYEDFLFMVMRNNSEMELRIVRRDVHRVTIARNQIRSFFATNEENESNTDNIHDIEVGEVGREEDEELWTTTITKSIKVSNKPLVWNIKDCMCLEFYYLKLTNRNAIFCSLYHRAW